MENRVRDHLLSKAEKGDPIALRWFLTHHHCKVYTAEEVAVLNKLHADNTSEAEQPTINVRHKELHIRLPSLHGPAYLAQINWLRRMEPDKPYYIAGLTYVEGPYGGGSTEWVVKTHPTEGFVPMFCTLYW